jgi:hypothetical protein
MLAVIIGTLKDVSNIIILMLVFIFCYMMIGMELFAYKVKLQEQDRLPIYLRRSNFNTLLEAFLSVFIVLANDGWAQIFVDHYRTTDSLLSSIYFISLIIIG